MKKCNKIFWVNIGMILSFSRIVRTLLDKIERFYFPKKKKIFKSINFHLSFDKNVLTQKDSS